TAHHPVDVGEVHLVVVEERAASPDASRAAHVHPLAFQVAGAVDAGRHVHVAVLVAELPIWKGRNGDVGKLPASGGLHEPAEARIPSITGVRAGELPGLELEALNRDLPVDEGPLGVDVRLAKGEDQLRFSHRSRPYKNPASAWRASRRSR